MNDITQEAAALMRTMKSAGCSDETIQKALWEFSMEQVKVIEREVEQLKDKARNTDK